MTTHIFFNDDRSDLLAGMAKRMKSAGEVVCFPEVKGGIPLSPPEVLKITPGLVGQTIVTGSEYIILWFLCEIRNQRMNCHNLRLFWVDEEGGTLCPIDKKGEFVNRLPHRFFSCRADLLFD